MPRPIVPMALSIAFGLALATGCETNSASCDTFNATRCLADGTAAERCRSDGNWSVVQVCTETQACETDASGASACAEVEGLIQYPDPTITDTTSPWYERGCLLVQYKEYPSDLIADCRCFTNQAPVSGIDICKGPRNVAAAGVRVGEGPSYADQFNIEFLGGYLAPREGTDGTLYVALGFGGSTDRSGAVVAVDVATGDRRVVSGVAPDGSTVGAGPAFGTVNDVQQGPDGNLYAWVRQTLPAEQELFRIDPTTGDRSLLWKGRADGSPQCPSSDDPSDIPLQVTDSGFAVGPDGSFYLPFGNPTQGRGILRLPSDVSRCEVFTGTGTPFASRGTGPEMGGFVQGFTLRDGILYAFTTQPKQFLAIDTNTGDRLLLYEPSGITPPERWAAYDKQRDVWWLAGFQNSVSIEAVDLINQEQTSIFRGGVFPWMPLGAAGPIQINSLNYGPVWFHPSGNLLVAQDGMSIVVYEPSTGNSLIRSL